ncbi:MAG TPA: hypothetical protein VFE37_03920 [Chloroflexota bacterium]|nr:hypothetical protein [Chloroflexota bacterium]
MPGRRWPWIRLFGRGDGDAADSADDVAREYAAVALELLARCDELHQRWLEQLEEQSRHERLANAAAVYYWYLSSLRERLQRLEAPPALRAWHEALSAALDGATRATQLMSHGYRFHNVRRICEGSLLLDDALGQAVAVRDALARLCDVSALSPRRPAERAAGS